MPWTARCRGQVCIELSTASRGSSFVYSSKQPFFFFFFFSNSHEITVLLPNRCWKRQCRLPRTASLIGTRRRYTHLASWRSTSFSWRLTSSTKTKLARCFCITFKWVTSWSWYSRFYWPIGDVIYSTLLELWNWECDIETSERYRSIGMLGKEMGYEISTCRMQYDANNKETNKKDPRVIYFGGNGPRKCRKLQVSWGHYHKWFTMEYTSAMFTLRLIGPLASWDEIFTLVHKR